MRKEEFEKKLEHEEKSYESFTDNNGALVYELKNCRLMITDCQEEGIVLAFSCEEDSPETRIKSIYTWSDVFDLAYLIVENPEKYKDMTEPDLNQLLGRDPFLFDWRPQRGFLDFSDKEVSEALRQVKLGCIYRLTCQDERFVVIEGSVSEQLQVHSLPLRASLPEITLSKDEVGESAEEPQDIGMLSLCGYLYYAYVNGSLYELRQERNKTRKAYRKVNDPYQFTWKTESGLKRFPENLFQLALMLAKERIVYVGKELTEDNRIIIYYSGLIWECEDDNDKNLDVTTCLMAETLVTMGSGSFTKEKFFEIRDGDNFLADKRSPLGMGKSIYYCAGYIRYLRETGRQEDIDANRAWYRIHIRGHETPVRSKFSFKLPNDLFMDLSLPFETAEFLQERNCVSLCREKDPEEKFCIRTLNALQITDLETAQKEIQYGVPFFWQRGETIKLSDFSEVYDNGISAELRCIYLAAYIDYLRRTGQYEDYKEKRQMDLAGIQMENPALQKLLKEADHKDKASLYCVIEGERTVGKRGIIDLIASQLKQSGKIDSADAKSLSFVDAAQDIAKMSRFEKRKLYVLSDLRDFLPMITDEKMRDKKLTETDISSLIKHLGRYQSETYIIVVCEERYAREFLKLSSQIQILFRDNIIPIDNLPPEKMYEIYTEDLSETLKVKVLQDDGFKDRFVNYIAENRSFFPFDNQELAQYLAGYANNKECLELPSVRPSAESANYEKQLDQFVGMENIKKRIRDMAEFMDFQKKAAKKGSHISAGYLHMIFAGNPGTGKTTIAKIMADMLYSIGMIKTNKLVAVERKDLVGEYIGHTGPKTSRVIQRAMDGVLFIDEAYSLTPKSEKDFGAEAIATLIEAMGEYKDRLVVIFAGYQKEMEEFVDSNPGIRSRIGYEFYFEDYTPDELTEIFRMKLVDEEHKFKVKKEALEKAYTVFDFYSKKENFGNGRFVDDLIRDTCFRHAGRRLSDEDPDLLVIRGEDVPGIADLTDSQKNPVDETTLEDVVGLKKVREGLKEFEAVADFLQTAKREKKLLKNFKMHMIFYGNPGTGKSTIARIVMEELYSRGLILECRIKEVNAQDLLRWGAGEIDNAQGGILLIDDADLLAKAREFEPGADAMDRIYREMAGNDLVIIFAGKKENIKKWIATAPRLDENIGFRFDFEDCKPGELSRIYVKKMKENGFKVSNGARSAVTRLMKEFSNMENFENGRFVDRVVQESFMQHAQTCTEENFEIIETDDVPSAERMKELLNIRQVRKIRL